MSYAPKRPHISKALRARIFAREDGRCYLCGSKINADEPWQADHELARELGGSDEEANLRPAHATCHRIKSRGDIKLIAKSNRIRRELGPKEQRRKRTAIPQPKVHQWPQGQKLKSRGFSKPAPRSG